MCVRVCVCVHGPVSAEFASRVPEISLAMNKLYKCDPAAPDGPLKKAIDRSSMLGDGFCQMGLQKVCVCVCVCVFSAARRRRHWSSPLAGAPDIVQATELQHAITVVVERIEMIQKDLKSVCLERAHFRKEIEHYSDKVKKLTAKDNSKKADENKDKLRASEAEFERLDAEVKLR